MASKKVDMYETVEAVKEKIKKARPKEGNTILSFEYEELCVMWAALTFFQIDFETEKNALCEHKAPGRFVSWD